MVTMFAALFYEHVVGDFCEQRLNIIGIGLWHLFDRDGYEPLTSAIYANSPELHLPEAHDTWNLLHGKQRDRRADDTTSSAFATDRRRNPLLFFYGIKGRIMVTHDRPF